MKFLSQLQVASSLLVCTASSSPLELRATAPSGTGPYPASYAVVSGLTNHTLFAPTNPPAGLKLPVLAWGETGCTHDALVFQAFLTEVASHGVLVIANGIPNGPGNPNGVADTSNPNGAEHKAAIDWITSVAGTGNYSNVDASRIAVAGQSCGGMQAYMLAKDPRVSAIGIFNSGFINATDPLPTEIIKPIFYFLGGSTDIAYTNGERDYTVLPASTPKWKGNLPTGHMGTYSQANGGKFGVAAVQWTQWLLRGNATAAKYFTDSGTGTAVGDGWTVVKGNLDGIKVSPVN